MTDPRPRPDYAVDPAALRDIARSLHGRADEADELVRAAKDADVPSASWGLLGHELGLYDLYAEVRDQADASLTRIAEFLAWAAQNLTETAGDYEEQDHAAAAAFARLVDQGGRS